MAIGYIKKKMVEGVETLVPETTAGPSAGTVRKLSFDCNIDYAVPITADETGEGYIGVSGNRKLSFNPKFNIGTVADPEYIGVLKADCFCGKGTNTEIADCVEIGEVCQNLNYKVPFTCNCEVLTACSQNLLFNPNTGLLCSNCMCIANNLEVLCDICADEYKSRTAGVGITVDTTAEDDTLNHNGDVIYKGCDGELATSSCKDFKYNPSTGTLTVDHVCSCDIQNEIKADKLCNTGTSSICYCSSATAQDDGAVSMHAYRCEVGSNNPLEGYATLTWDGLYLTCVPFYQQEGNSSTYNRTIIGNGCNIWETQCCSTNRIQAYRCGSCAGLCEGVKVTDSNGCLCCGIWTDSTASTGLFTTHALKTIAGWRCPSIKLESCNTYSAARLSNCLVDSTTGNAICIAGISAYECLVAGFVGNCSGDIGTFLLDCDGIFKVSNSCTSNNYARVLTECDSGAISSITDGYSKLEVHRNNELNFHPESGTATHFNYSGGSSKVCIWDGSGQGCLGSLYAGILCLSDCMAISKSGDTCPSINIGKWDIAADTLHAYFAGYSTTTGAGYAGGVYLGKLNDLVDGRWGQVQIGYYDAEHDNTRYCPRISFYRADCGICMHDSVKIASGKVLCTQTICFY